MRCERTVLLCCGVEHIDISQCDTRIPGKSTTPSPTFRWASAAKPLLVALFDAISSASSLSSSLGNFRSSLLLLLLRWKRTFRRNARALRRRDRFGTGESARLVGSRFVRPSAAATADGDDDVEEDEVRRAGEKRSRRALGRGSVEGLLYGWLYPSHHSFKFSQIQILCTYLHFSEIFDRLSIG